MPVEPPEQAAYPFRGVRGQEIEYIHFLDFSCRKTRDISARSSLLPAISAYYIFPTLCNCKYMLFTGNLDARQPPGAIGIFISRN